MSKAMRQMPQQCGRVGETCGEAGREAASDEADDPFREHPSTGSAMPMASTGGLLEVALTREPVASELTLPLQISTLPAHHSGPSARGLPLIFARHL